MSKFVGIRPWARTRQKKPRNESVEQRRKRQRESQKWGHLELQVADAFRRYSVHPPRIIAVCDREADIFALLEVLRERGRGFVIRATFNRQLLTDDEQGPCYSLEEARSAPVSTTMVVHVPARPGQTERDALPNVRATRCTIQPPRADGRKGEPQAMNIVLVEEIDPPNKKQALCCFLLSSEPIDTVDQVLRVVRIYEMRWVIEELHMGLKTGCSMEKRQLAGSHALMNFLAFATVGSVRLLKLRDAARSEQSVPARRILTPEQLGIPSSKFPKLSPDCSAKEALHFVARLGGHMGSRKVQPGWRTQWRGMRRLLYIEEGYKLAQRL